jgi:hypothetical protein
MTSSDTHHPDHPLAESLQQQLGHDAHLVSLPERRPGRAVARARTRRRNRRSVLVAGAVVLLGAAAALPALRSQGSSDTEGDVATQGGILLPTGPLDLEWQRYQGGPDQRWDSFQDDDRGVIYTLATAPGIAADDDGTTTRALYRLGDDGSWQPVVLEGDTAPTAVDAAASDGLLYAVSTGPGAGSGDGDGVVRLSSSDDGGTTWTNEDLPSVAPPSTTVDWDRQQTLVVESHGSTTLALVTTTFTLATPEELFPELTALDDGGSGRGDLSIKIVEDGLAVVRPEGTGVDEDEDSGPEIVDQTGEDHVLRTVPWSELGVDGAEALMPPSQVLRSGDDGWQPLESPGASYANLTVAGGRFVLFGSPTGATPGPAVRSSEDGTSWDEVNVPAPGRIVGVNDVLVDVPDDFTGGIHASPDGGRTWQPVDLATTAGIAADSEVVAVSGGPLGLALITTDWTESQLVVSGDLVDWTATPLAEVTGIDAGATSTAVFVGADRIVVRVTPVSDGGDSLPPPETITAIAVPAAAAD